MNNFGYAFPWLRLADLMFDDWFKTYSSGSPRRVRIEVEPNINKQKSSNINTESNEQNRYSQKEYKETMREYINKLKRKSKEKLEKKEEVKQEEATVKEDSKAPIDNLTDLSRTKTITYFKENLKNLSNPNLYWLMHAIVIELKNRDKTTTNHTTEV